MRASRVEQERERAGWSRSKGEQGGEEREGGGEGRVGAQGREGSEKESVRGESHPRMPK